MHAEPLTTTTLSPLPRSCTGRHNRQETVVTPAPRAAFPAMHAARLVARRFTSNRVEQEDLAATALLGLLEYADKRAITPQEILADPNWRILQCRAMDRVRQQQRRRRGHQVWATLYTEPQVATAPLRNRLDLGDAVRRAAEVLDPDQHTVLCAVYLGGESLAHVARSEGWSHPSTRRRHDKMLGVLRRSLEEPKATAKPLLSRRQGGRDKKHP